jgi:hypothetical protein
MSEVDCSLFVKLHILLLFSQDVPHNSEFSIRYREIRARIGRSLLSGLRHYLLSIPSVLCS